MKIKNTFAVLMTLSVMCIANNAIASLTGFDGATVTFAGFCCSAPTEPNRGTQIVSATVGSEIEFPSIGQLGARTIDANIDISNSQVSVDYTVFSTTAVGAFNGYVLDFSPVGAFPEISDLILNSETTFATGGVDLSFDSDTIRISLPGQTITPDARILVDVSFAPVPLPGAVLFFTSGLFGLWSVIKRTPKLSVNLA